MSFSSSSFVKYLLVMTFQSHSSVPANKFQIITKSAPATKAFATSQGQVVQPSAQINEFSQ
ncbi:MAG: hypothetical protein LBC61_04265 [Candidatus Peribacteria bacterium]|nr:hypothetical protein [Candidatus Peribacteria bacterium]